MGNLHQLTHTAFSTIIMTADSTTLKFHNQKNNWQGICIHHHWNRMTSLTPVRALGWQFIHICDNATGEWGTYLSAVFNAAGCMDVSDKDIMNTLKTAAAAPDYLC